MLLSPDRGEVVDASGTSATCSSQELNHTVIHCSRQGAGLARGTTVPSAARQSGWQLGGLCSQSQYSLAKEPFLQGTAALAHPGFHGSIWF